MRAAHFATLVGLFFTACSSKDREPSADGTASGAPGAPLTSPSSDLGAAPQSTTVASDDAPLPAPEGAALVDLTGKYHPRPAAPDSAPKVYVRAMLAPVYARPDAGSKVIGFLRVGTPVEADPTDLGRAGCPGGMRGIKPVGFVCLGDKVTTDPDDPIVRAITRGPDRSQKLPYMYGTVTRGGPVYGRLPTEDERDKLEPGLEKHLKKWKTDPVSGADYGLELWFKWKANPPKETAWDIWESKTSDESIPESVRTGLPNLSGQAKPGLLKIGQVDRKQGFSFLDTYVWEGRRYNLSTDLRLIPADRLRPIRGSDYHGVAIGTDVQFPFALIKKKGGKRYTWSASKNAMTVASDLEYRDAIQLTGKQKIVGGRLHYETDDGTWVDDRHASRLDPAKRMPKWGKNGEKWLDVNITKQTLVAYEGERPVYATLVSTGEDGLEEGGRATKKGIFRIHTKYVSTTMDSDTVGEEFELRDVPYVQYFEEGYALHGAYWHDGFGTPKSHGCINLAPEDARRLFYWTEPHVPADFHGAAKALTGTVLFIHP